ncbi:hypothetical protein ACFL41_01805 [Gemmatimonadota bacterium]
MMNTEGVNPMPDLNVSISHITKESSDGARTGVKVQFANQTDREVTINPVYVASPSLVLQVRNDKGQRIHLPPPPLPNPDEDKIERTIRPGETYEVAYRGFLDLYQASGRYQVRYYSSFPQFGGSERDPLESEWLDIEVICPERKPVKFFKGEDISRPIRVRFLIIRRIICWLLRMLRLLRCTKIRSTEVDMSLSQEMTDAPAGKEAWNGTYGWHARFFVEVNQPDCAVYVTVRLRTINDGADLSNAEQVAWENALQNAWSNLFKLCYSGCCCENGYPIHLDVQFVNSNEHNIVNVQNSTTNMGNWGDSDTVSICHEMGHMLGARDEYYTVDGVAWGLPFQNGAGIMNNPNEAPLDRHYNLVRLAASILFWSSCETVAVGDQC